MAVSGKRLFWLSIIIVELVAVYLLWRPYRDRLIPAPHRVAVAPAVTHPAGSAMLPPPAPRSAAKASEPKPSETGPSPQVMAHRKPPAALRSRPAAKTVVVNAGLKTPEPIATKAPAPISPTTAGGTDSLASFWCRISMMEPKCDCQQLNAERATSQPLMPGEFSH